ncbi:unnamed protein product, partial [Effrenium voratum]
QVFLSALFQRLRPELSVEVGSFKGGSALRILSALDRTSKRSCLVCIDTFLGDASMWLNRRATGRGSLQLHRGHPQIYEQFMANTQSYADSPGLHRSLPGGLSQWLARASAAGSGGRAAESSQPTARAASATDVPVRRNCLSVAQRGILT